MLVVNFPSYLCSGMLAINYKLATLMAFQSQTESPLVGLLQAADSPRPSVMASSSQPTFLYLAKNHAEYGF